MDGAGGQPLVAAHDVADLHQVIVHHVGQVIGGIAVRLEQDNVLQGRIVHRGRAAQHVVEGGLSLQWGLEADHRLQALRFPLSHLRGGQRPAVAVVADVRPVLGLLLLAHLGQPLRAAKALVGLALVEQLLCVLGIELQPLG